MDAARAERFVRAVWNKGDALDFKALAEDVMLAIRRG
jgi:hypothetical protein